MDFDFDTILTILLPKVINSQNIFLLIYFPQDGQSLRLVWNFKYCYSMIFPFFHCPINTYFIATMCNFFLFRKSVLDGVQVQAMVKQVVKVTRDKDKEEPSLVLGLKEDKLLFIDWFQNTVLPINSRWYYFWYYNKLSFL